MIALGPMPEEDSQNFSDTDARLAIPTDTIEDILGRLRGLRCPECTGTFENSEHALRRRAPHLYWKVTLHCEAWHETSLIFRTDWLTKRS